MRPITANGLCALIALAVLCLAAPVRAGARERTAAQCPRPRSRILAADPQAVVYTAPERPQNPEFLGVYGCSYRAGRSYYLGRVPSTAGTPLSGGGVELETLAGSMAAYEEISAGDWVVTVRRLTDGKLVNRAPTGTPAHAQPPRGEGEAVADTIGVGPATAIVVKSDGAVAWIAEADGEGDYQVHALDSGGNRLLAHIDYDERFSLALAGSLLYWSENGRPMSATLS